jgi:hypothetical protein
MSNIESDELVFDENGDKVLNPRIREQMRSQEKQNKELQARLREAELRGIYAELGIPNTGLAKLFRDGYQGEATLEAVKSAASQYDGLLPAPTSPVDDDVQAQLEALRRVNSANDSTNTKDAMTVLDEVKAKLKGAKTPEEFDDILASADVQSLRNQPISFS